MMEYEVPILNEREQTHGDYIMTADLAQTMKDWFRAQPSWGCMRRFQRESLDLIATKLSRVLSGNSDEIDHWRDISGYAQLVVARLQI